MICIRLINIQKGKKMRTIHQKISLPEIEYPIEFLAPIEKILFFDIETTGFAAKNSNIYLIGCLYHLADGWNQIQWFADKYNEEGEIISAFMTFSLNYTHLVHFNGTNFDIPFMEQKCQQLHFSYSFEHLTGIDLYKRVSPYKFVLNTPNFKQKSLEYFLGIKRKDTFQGGELINVYHNYVDEPVPNDLQLLLLHNADDLKGLVQLLPLLSYYDLFNRPLTAKKVQANTYRDYFGNPHQELLIRVSLPCKLPVSIKCHANSCYFSGKDKIGHFRIPIYEEELKYYYTNYKDYYYLPDEDVAIHRSVASFVDKDYRIKATASTCYTRKFSSYLPEWDLLIQPFFRRDYRSKEVFFELTDDIKQNREIFSRYAEHILHMIAYAF